MATSCVHLAIFLSASSYETMGFSDWLGLFRGSEKVVTFKQNLRLGVLPPEAMQASACAPVQMKSSKSGVGRGRIT